MLLLGLIELPTWLAAIGVLCFSICCYSWYKQRFFSRLGIKTKSTNLVIGDLPTLIRTGFSYIDYDMVKENGKVFGLFLGNTPTLVVHDVNMLKQILVKDFHNFTNRITMVNVDTAWESAMTIATDNHWKYLRATMSPAFSSGKLRHMCQLIDRSLHNLEDFLDEKVKEAPEGFDLSPILRSFTLDVIVSTTYGMDVNAIRNPDNDFIASLHRIASFNPGSVTVLLSVIFPDLLKILPKFDILPKEQYQYVKTVLLGAFADRKTDSSSQKDMLQLMINATKDNAVSSDQLEDDASLDAFKERGLTDDEILVNSLIFMSAGFDTTAGTLNWMLYELVINPDWMSKLVKEVDECLAGAHPDYDNISKVPLMGMVVNETLRLHPPVTRPNRQTREDITIDGVRIPKGTDVTFSPLALHYDPDFWKYPTKFDPLRFSPENEHQIEEYAYMPFGTGPRHCIGMRLALLEVKITLAFLLQNYHITRSSELSIPMPEDRRVMLKPGKPVHLIVKKRLVAA